MLIFEFDYDCGKWEAREIGPDGALLQEGAARVVHLQRGTCVLLSRGRVVVNGIGPLPLMVLSDRDEIQCGDRTYYFSSDAAAESAVFRSAGRELRCARCQGPLVDGEMSVQCPACQARHHESCWTYRQSPGCQKCKHPAAQFAWTPEQLS